MSDILSLLVILVALGIAVAIGWWLFRMVFWLVIYFIGEAGARVARRQQEDGIVTYTEQELLRRVAQLEAALFALAMGRPIALDNEGRPFACGPMPQITVWPNASTTPVTIQHAPRS